VLPSLLGLDVTDEERMAIAATLGSDIPFFLQDSSAEASGRGEILTPFSWSCPWWILLVHPAVHVSTAWAYGHLRVGDLARPSRLREALQRADTDRKALETVLHNDFEDVVVEAHPVIGATRDRMLAAGAHGALMSGSGSSVFGLFREENAAAACAAQFPEEYVTSLTAPAFSPVHIVHDA
jgi:4-diphosphocytidyl-2-C-methyl-D-erythritol kinase